MNIKKIAICTTVILYSSSILSNFDHEISIFDKTLQKLVNKPNDVTLRESAQNKLTAVVCGDDYVEYQRVEFLKTILSYNKSHVIQAVLYEVLMQCPQKFHELSGQVEEMQF